MLDRLKHYGAKVQAVGLNRFYRAATMRAQKGFFQRGMKGQALVGTAHSNWQDLPESVKKAVHDISSLSYLSYLSLLL